MITNLGIPLKKYKQRWEESHLSNGKECTYHNTRFEEGWIPLAAVPFYPALNRFNEKNKLAKKIVEVLQTQGKYNFSENNHSITELEPALIEIMGTIPHDIEMIIADNNSGELLLDRKAFTIGGNKIDCYIQWYISRTKKDF